MKVIQFILLSSSSIFVHGQQVCTDSVATDESCVGFDVQLRKNIQEAREGVLHHPLYELMRNTANTDDMETLVRIFQEHHVWAVLDYFQILKRLQGDLTRTTLPWFPKGDRHLRRFINEIVTEEETDVFEDMTTPGSHLELYIRGMDQSGANTQPIKKFLQYVENSDVALDADALAQKAIEFGAPVASAQHFANTVGSAFDQGSLVAVAGIFAFGREDIIPSMFSGILDTEMVKKFSILKFYLERHIQLDGDDHGPLSLRLVQMVCGDDPKKWSTATEATISALNHRRKLWQGVFDAATAALQHKKDL